MEDGCIEKETFSAGSQAAYGFRRKRRCWKKETERFSLKGQV
jgi:hypothetical protein